MTGSPLQFLLDFSVLARYPCIRGGRMYQLAVRHKSNGTVAVLAWRRSFACFQYIPIIAFLAEKSKFFCHQILYFRGNGNRLSVFDVAEAIQEQSLE